MMVGVSFLLGEIMVACNLWLKKGVGSVVVTGFALMPYIIRRLSDTLTPGGCCCGYRPCPGWTGA